MVAPDQDFDGAALLRTTFSLIEGHGPVTSGVLLATSLGVYEAFLNGKRVGEDVLSPGWSSYEWRIRYRSYDVTALVQEHNAVGVALGNGWHRGRLGFRGGDALYGDELAAFVQLEITYADGTTQVVATDESWQAGPSSTSFNQLYDGQTIDARREPLGWSTAGFEAVGGTGVHALDFDANRLVPPIAAPVVRHETMRPQRIWRSPAGKTLIDFGQNLVGWIRFTINGLAGSTITIRHAEVLEHDELGTRPLRTALATDRFILSGGTDTFEPTKTFHGFRYAEVDGWPGTLSADSLEAVVVHSQLQRIGHFACSDERLNQLHSNVVWSLRGNFLDLPTDCPQRDERLGWTGDIAVFAPTAAYLFDVNNFLQDWLADLAAEQRAAGWVPIVVPDLFKLEAASDEVSSFGLGPTTAIWGDAAVWVPWTLWEAYGDLARLEANYESMASHVRTVETLLSPNGCWDQGGQFGDWLDPDAPLDRPADSKVDPALVATASAYRSASMVRDAARVLERAEDEAHFAGLADRLRRSFNHEYVGPDGFVHGDCATGYALAITFGLLDEPDKQAAGARLAALVEAAGYRVSTGFAGTPFVTHALSQTGQLVAAYRLLLETGCPSWLYPVSMGATTIWERWDSMLPDGAINPGEMTSFNHYALGAIADWLHKVVVGISPAAPGYAKIRIAPRPGGGLTWAEGSLDTPHGSVHVRWEVRKEGMVVRIETPAGVPTEVDLPGEAPFYTHGGHVELTVQLRASDESMGSNWSPRHDPPRRARNAANPRLDRTLRRDAVSPLPGTFPTGPGRRFSDCS